MLVACSAAQQEITHTVITAEQAMEMMVGGVVILDVRDPNEFATGHIENAILLPVDEIAGVVDVIADRNATVLIYCRSGRRSSEAARAMVELGFTNVYDFGGILDWHGEVVVP